MVLKELFCKFCCIEIIINWFVNDQFVGWYVSVIRGQGLAFCEVRLYQFGDDVCVIDWNVLVCMNEVYVKVFVEECEMIVMVVVDVLKG